MNRDLVNLEIRRGRSRLILEKIVPGPLLAAAHPGVSFFYRVICDGSLRCMTPDPEEARAIWRGAHRWMLTGAATAHVLL